VLEEPIGLQRQKRRIDKNYTGIKMEDFTFSQIVANDIDYALDYEYDVDIISLVHSALAITPQLKAMFLFGKDKYGIDLMEDKYEISNCEIAISFRVCLLHLFGNMFVSTMNFHNLYTSKDFNKILEAIYSIDKEFSYLTEKIRMDEMNDLPFLSEPLLADDWFFECEMSDYIMDHAISQSEVMFKPFNINKIKIKEGKKNSSLSSEIDEDAKMFEYFFKMIQDRLEGREEESDE
jgi:hypothetical protein